MLKILKNLIHGREAITKGKPSAIPQEPNLRRFARLSTKNRELINIRINDSKYHILDLSYGGFAVQCGEEIKFSKTPIPAELKLIDKKITAKAFCTHQQSKVAGFCFQHEDPSVLLFLRECLEPIRYGGSIDQIDPAYVNDRLKSPPWKCFRGEGPTDLLVNSVENGALKQALLTFRRNDKYWEVSIKNNKVVTRVSIDSVGVGARVAETNELNKEAIRFAVCTLLGIQDTQILRSTAKFFESLVKELKS